MLSLIKRSLEFTAYHLLIKAVDKISKLPRNSQPSDLERLYRENLALKAQLDWTDSAMITSFGMQNTMLARERMVRFQRRRDERPHHASRPDRSPMKRTKAQENHHD